MEVIAVIMAAMASLRRNIVMPFLAWRLSKLASEKGQYVEIDVERLTGAVRITYDGRSSSGSYPILGIEVERGREFTENDRVHSALPTPKKEITQGNRKKRSSKPGNRSKKSKGKRRKRLSPPNANL